MWLKGEKPLGEGECHLDDKLHKECWQRRVYVVGQIRELIVCIFPGRSGNRLELGIIVCSIQRV
eukprot:m.312497 g.312497  ORF g.312497 m.312497 type:complete len:64 (+) comp270104_c0_seq1:323-514(+)